MKKLTKEQRDWLIEQMWNRRKEIDKEYPFLASEDFKALTLSGVEDVINQCTEGEDNDLS